MLEVVSRKDTEGFMIQSNLNLLGHVCRLVGVDKFLESSVAAIGNPCKEINIWKARSLISGRQGDVNVVLIGRLHFSTFEIYVLCISLIKAFPLFG